MPADLHARAKQVFLQAIERPPQERISFIDGACSGDLELHQEVVGLLEYHTKETIVAKPTKQRGHGDLAVTEVDRQPASRVGHNVDGEKPRVLIAPKTPQMTDETSQLLRLRLRAVALVLAIALAVTFFRSLMSGEVLLVWLRVVVLAIMVGCCGLLYSRLAIDLKLLRAVELVVLLAIGTQLVLVESTAMVHFATSDDAVSTVSAGILNHVGWSMVILIYGVFMPNSWKRAALILVPAACIPFAVTFLVCWRHEQVAELFRENRFNIPIPMPMLAAFVAIYAAHIIHSARREAFEARQYGQYRLKDKLGAGGMGEVYQAEHLLLKRPCAIKLIRPEHVADPRVLARFEREVKATAKLSHWNTIEIYDYGQAADGAFYYVMELLDGLNFDDMVDRYGPLPPARAVHFLSQTCSALREAHATGLVHRDIKPANIFAARIGGVYDVTKLLDFGVVRETMMPEDPNLTGMGTIVGTSLYMSPEQALASGYATAAADIYSLGAVAYFLVTGRPPFVGTSISQVLIAHAQEDVTPPSEFRADLPEDVERIIIRCLEKKPRDRFQTAEDFGQALGDCACADQWSQQQAVEWWQQHRKADSQLATM